VSRVLVTGASGFIGANVIDCLLAGDNEVHAVARHHGAQRAGVTWHEADLLGPGGAEQVAAAAGAERLLHLAWCAQPGFWSAPENELWADASLRLLRAFAEAGGRRATVAGTCAEYEWGNEPLREDLTPLLPATLYGVSKHQTHIAATELCKELGVALSWGRVFFLYGPREGPERLVSGVARALLSGEQVPTTEGHQRRDFMHVRDVADALVALLASPVGGAVNIASGDAPEVREIIRLIAAETGGIERVRFGALPLRDGEPELIVGDSRRLRDEVGYRPAIALEQGIAETVSWWRSHR